MKGVLESEESCGAHGAIGYCYWRLEQIDKEMEKPRAPIDVIVDRATGRRETQEKEWFAETVFLLEAVIENKKIIEADYSADANMLNTIKTYQAKFEERIK